MRIIYLILLLPLYKYNKETPEYYHDFDWNEFVEKLFQQPPHDPFTFRMEFLEVMDPQKLSKLLGNMLIKGAKQLHNKEISQLTPEEFTKIKKYYHSIGFGVEYVIKTQTQYVPKLKKTLPVNHFQIDFKPLPKNSNRM
jgi:hypothetical protein